MHCTHGKTWKKPSWMYEIKNRRIGDCTMMSSKSRKFLINVSKLAGFRWLQSKHWTNFHHVMVKSSAGQIKITSEPIQNSCFSEGFLLASWLKTTVLQPFSRSNLLAAINVDTVSSEVSAEVSRLCGCMVLWWANERLVSWALDKLTR